MPDEALFQRQRIAGAAERIAAAFERIAAAFERIVESEIQAGPGPGCGNGGADCHATADI